MKSIDHNDAKRINVALLLAHPKHFECLKMKKK
jgi:hypothetical protein